MCRNVLLRIRARSCVVWRCIIALLAKLSGPSLWGIYAPAVESRERAEFCGPYYRAIWRSHTRAPRWHRNAGLPPALILTPETCNRENANIEATVRRAEIAGVTSTR